MDHSIFGNLMNINDEDTGEWKWSQNGLIPPYFSNREESERGTRELSTTKALPKRKAKKKYSVKNKELRFKCEQCEYRTWKKSNYQRHLGTHNRKLQKCKRCPYLARHMEDLNKHVLRYHQKDRFLPDNSKKMTLNPDLLDVPEFQFTSRDGVQIFKIKNEINQKLSDNSCNSFSKGVNDDLTKREVKEDAELFCPPVEVYLEEQISNLDGPESSVEEEEEYDSDVFPLTVHIDIATPCEDTVTISKINTDTVPNNNNNISISKSKDESSLRDDKELRYACPCCSYRTWKTSNYQRHLLRHTSERPHKCKLCQYSGKHNEDLKRHMLCHNQALFGAGSQSDSGENSENLIRKLPAALNIIKRYGCQLCDFKTTRSSVLNRHQRAVHNESRPFACNLCPYRSKQRDSLKKHMMSHTGERPFQCLLCDYKCRQTGDLKRHQFLHTGEKPFVCPHCSYSSNRSQLLKKHLAKRHPTAEIVTDVPVTKTNQYDEFTGAHYLAEMF